MAIRLLSWYRPASEAASQTEPSAALAVAQQHIGPVIQIIQPGAKRHADADAQALAQRTGGHIDKRQARRGVAFEVASELAQLQQFFNREQPGLSPGRVQQRGRMAFGENETVVVVVLGFLGS